MVGTFSATATNEQQLKAKDLLIERRQKDATALQEEMALAGKEPWRQDWYREKIRQNDMDLRGLVAARDALQKTVYAQTGNYEALLNGESRDAYLALKAAFKNYGLESLAGKIFDYVKNGNSADTISLLLQDSDEYKKRFAANELRKKAGMSVLSPGEYIAAENSYRQIMRQSGLPKGFYDNNEDFNQFLGADVSPTELQDRVNLATQASVLANTSYKEALQQMGISQGDIAAYFLDSTKAMPFIQKAAAQAAIGAEALKRGFQFDQQYTEELATSGISRDQANQAYAKIGDEYSTLSTLGEIYGGGWTQRQAEEDIFKGGNEASMQKRRLGQTERGNFAGNAGSARGGLAQKGGQQ